MKSKEGSPPNPALPYRLSRTGKSAHRPRSIAANTKGGNVTSHGNGGRPTFKVYRVGNQIVAANSRPAAGIDLLPHCVWSKVEATQVARLLNGDNQPPRPQNAI